MLSRIARQMYWLGRNVEHAENMTRILDVNHKMSLEQAYFSELDVWTPILSITHAESLFAEHYEEVNRHNVYDFLLLNPHNPDAVLSRINLAREAARVMRDHMSSEMWLSLNMMYLSMQKHQGKSLSQHEYEALCEQIHVFCHAFHGMADNTMVHGKGWQFLRLGWSIERALMSSRILEMKYHILLPDASEVGRPLDIHQWQALLRSVSGYEAYRRLYQARIVPSLVAELFLTEARFPRSVHYCIQNIILAIQALDEDNATPDSRVGTATERLTTFFSKTGKEILADGLKSVLGEMQAACMQLHDEIHQAYFNVVIHTGDHGQVQLLAVQVPQQQQAQHHANSLPEHPRLQVRHVTRFDYSDPVTCAHSEIRKTPVPTGLQKVLETSLTVNGGDTLSYYHDHFGNTVHHYSCLEPNDCLEIISESIVETTDAISCGIHGEHDDQRTYTQRWAEFLSFSPGVPKLEVYQSVPCLMDVEMTKVEFEQALHELAAYFFLNFRYDPTATDVHSSPQDLFDHGGGVCQDTAHAMLGVLRSVGIASRYVSGYIYDSQADEPGAALRGAAATHAWVQVWHPESGWIGADPTNNRLVDWQYIRTAVGRDYFDVQPVRGTFYGEVEQTLEATVTVKRL